MIVEVFGHYINPDQVCFLGTGRNDQETYIRFNETSLYIGESKERVAAEINKKSAEHKLGERR